jgi:ABC-type maltose transport system permease subunit
MPTTGILVAFPVLIMALLIQRYVIRGLAIGVIK